MRQWKIWCSVLFCLCVANTGHAQFFRNLFGAKNTGQVSSSCPGGVCPTASAPSSAPVASNVVQAPFKVLDNARGHWSYPGTIDSHLEGTHGVATAGMSREEKLNLHDALHEGAQTVVTSVPRAGYRSSPQEFYPMQTAPMKSVSGGSSGGGSLGSFAVGKVYKGEFITSIGPVESQATPSIAPNLPKEPSAMESRRDRKASRTAITEAVNKAEAEGTITSSQARDIRRAAMRPMMLAQMEQLIAEKAQLEGYALPVGSDGEVQMSAIPWADLADFITKIAPFIFKLIELFSANTEGMKLEQFVNMLSDPMPQAYPEEWYQAA